MDIWSCWVSIPLPGHHQGSTWSSKREELISPKLGHLQVSWAMDFFTVPTLRFQILHVFVVLSHSRRQVVHFGVTAHPMMACVIQQHGKRCLLVCSPPTSFVTMPEVSRFW